MIFEIKFYNEDTKEEIKDIEITEEIFNSLEDNIKDRMIDRKTHKGFICIED